MAALEKEMTREEAKEKIAKEFIDRYYAWLNDYNSSELSDYDYGRKYCLRRNPDVSVIKDTQKNMLLFQSQIFAGRYDYAWESAGYSKQIIWKLHSDGFLSYDYDSSWKARQLGRSHFYYINQAKAKEIRNAYLKAEKS